MRGPELERPKSQTQPPRGYELSAREAIAIAAPRGEGAGRAPAPPALRAHRLHARAGTLAGQLVRRRPRGRPGAGRRSHRRGARGSGRATRWPGRWRAATRARSGASSMRRMCGSRCACSSSRRSSTRAGRSGCCTWTCSCCCPSLLRTCSSTAARWASPRRWCCPCSSTCSAGCCGPASARASAASGSCRWSRLAWLAAAIVVLVGFRVALNVVDTNVIDVGYAGVLGADRIADGNGIYGPGFSEDVPRGDTYGPVTYLAYVPFEQLLPWSGDVGRPARGPRRGAPVRPGDPRGPGAPGHAAAAEVGRVVSLGWRWASPGRRTRTRCSRCRPTPTTRCPACSACWRCWP